MHVGSRWVPYGPTCMPIMWVPHGSCMGQSIWNYMGHTWVTDGSHMGLHMCLTHGSQMGFIWDNPHVQHMVPRWDICVHGQFWTTWVPCGSYMGHPICNSNRYQMGSIWAPRGPDTCIPHGPHIGSMWAWPSPSHMGHIYVWPPFNHIGYLWAWPSSNHVCSKRATHGPGHRRTMCAPNGSHMGLTMYVWPWLLSPSSSVNKDFLHIVTYIVHTRRGSDMLTRHLVVDGGYQLANGRCAVRHGRGSWWVICLRRAGPPIRFRRSWIHGSCSKIKMYEFTNTIILAMTEFRKDR